VYPVQFLRKMRIGLALLVLAALASGEDDRVSIRVHDKALQRRIHTAIDRGVAYLKRTQQLIGYWGPAGSDKDLKRVGDLSHRGGYTALALYALAASGVPADDPAIMRGIAWIRKYRRAYSSGSSAATYANSLLVLALTRIDPKAHRDLIHRTTDKIARGELSSGFWTYTLGSATNPAKRDLNNPDRRAFNKGTSPQGRPDNSNTQFAVLALWAAESIGGYAVKDRKGQTDTGAWAYSNKRGNKRSATMTAAGIVSMVYAMAALDDRKDALDRVRRHSAVLKGLAALKRLSGGWTKGHTRGLPDRGNYYLIYSLERVGTVLALDPEGWYVQGARYLVERQGKTGGWSNLSERYYETSLALLFLTRATYPPVKGAVTPRDKPRPKAAITPKEKFPDVTTDRGLSRAFDQYREFKPEQRAVVVGEFGKAGPAAIGYFIGKLKDERFSVRRTAVELLTKLLDKRLLFDPAAEADEREMMLAPIEVRSRSSSGRAARACAGTSNVSASNSRNSP